MRTPLRDSVLGRLSIEYMPVRVLQQSLVCCLKIICLGTGAALQLAFDFALQNVTVMACLLSAVAAPQGNIHALLRASFEPSSGVFPAIFDGVEQIPVI